MSFFLLCKSLSSWANLGGFLFLSTKEFRLKCCLITCCPKENGWTWTSREAFWCRPTEWLLPAVVVQSLSRIQLFVMPWTAAHQAPLSSTISQSLLTFMSIESVMPSNHLIILSSDALFSFCLQSFPASGSFPACHCHIYKHCHSTLE